MANFPCVECGGKTRASKVNNLVVCRQCGKLQALPPDWIKNAEALKKGEITGPSDLVEVQRMQDEHSFVVPDYTDVFTGWRAWGIPEDAIDEPRLFSTTYKTFFWEPRERAEATCRKGLSHEPPNKSCRCGLYAAKTYEHMIDQRLNKYDADLNGMFRVVGQVNIWGRFIEGTYGWRHQFGYPKEIFVPYEAWRLVEPLEDAYGVPVRLKNILAQKA